MKHRLAWVLTSLVSLFPSLARELSAQNDPRLAAAVRLTQEGLGDSARSVVGRMLSTIPATDSLYPEVLFTAAVVAASTQDKRLYLQRVAVEFSQSLWADDARLQLAQLDYAAGDASGAMRQIERLLADYPLSPLRPTAALWGARSAFDARDYPLACQWARLGITEAGEDVELRNQLEFQRQRCQARVQAESATSKTAAPAPTGHPPARHGPAWYVQVAAFRTQQTADQTIGKLKQSKIPATIVRDDGLFKVRAGPYPSRERAQAALPAIQRQLGGKPFVLQAP